LTEANFEFKQTKKGPVLVIELLGYLGKEGGIAFAAIIEKSLAGGNRKFGLDFRRVDVINSQGISVLLEVGSRICEDFGGALAVFGLSPHLKLILEISCFFSFATTAQGEAEALKALE